MRHQKVLAFEAEVSCQYAACNVNGWSSLNRSVVLLAL